MGKYYLAKKDLESVSESFRLPFTPADEAHAGPLLVRGSPNPPLLHEVRLGETYIR
jgi:hypothetical protein